MRIAVVSAVFPPTLGGMCTVAAAEAEALHEAGNEVVVYTLQTASTRADKAFDRAFPVPIIRLLGLPRVWISGAVPQLLWHLRREKVVYAHLPAYGFFAVLLLWKTLFSGRLVVTLHMDPIGVGWIKYIFRFERFMLRAVLRRANAIRVSSSRMQDSELLRDLGPATLKKIHVIPFGINLQTFHPPQLTAQRENAVLFVGRLSRTHYFKGVDVLLRAFRTVKEHQIKGTGPLPCLWVVGDGEERARYEQVVKDLGISNAVTFLGAVSDTELPALYRRVRALVLPSIDTSETFGMVLLEAMASGTPVIASRLPGVDALVTHGSCGLLVEPGDQKELERALADVFENPDVWSARGIIARTAAERYGEWKTIAGNLATLL